MIRAAIQTLAWKMLLDILLTRAYAKHMRITLNFGGSKQTALRFGCDDNDIKCVLPLGTWYNARIERRMPIV